MNNENEFLDWNGSFMAEESSFKLFPAGEYPFTVTGFERKIYDGQSEKIQNGTPFAEIKLEFTGPEGTTNVEDRLFMTKKWQWKLTQFFTAIGQEPVLGQAFSPNWSIVVGSQGRAKLKINKYTKRDGSPGENNQVGDYLKPATQTSQQPTGTYQQTNPQQNTAQAQPQTGQQTTGFQPGAF